MKWMEDYFMDFIELDFIPIRIPSKYSECLNFGIDNSEIQLFTKYKTKIVISRNLFNKVSINFEFENVNTITEINEILFEKYGEPQYARFANQCVWKIGRLFLSHGEKEAYFQHSVHIINISYVKPCNLIAYSKYKEITKHINNILISWNLNLSFNTVKRSDAYHFYCVTQKFRYIFIVKKRRIIMHGVEINKEGKEEEDLVRWDQEQKFTSIQELENIIDSFLVYMEEYDVDLKKK